MRGWGVGGRSSIQADFSPGGTVTLLVFVAVG